MFTEMQEDVEVHVGEIQTWLSHACREGGDKCSFRERRKSKVIHMQTFRKDLEEIHRIVNMAGVEE